MVENDRRDRSIIPALGGGGGCLSQPGTPPALPRPLLVSHRKPRTARDPSDPGPPQNRACAQPLSPRCPRSSTADAGLRAPASCPALRRRFSPEAFPIFVPTAQHHRISSAQTTVVTRAVREPQSTFPSFLVAYNGFAVSSGCLLHNKGSQPYLYMDPLPGEPPSHPTPSPVLEVAAERKLSPCAVERLPTGCPPAVCRPRSGG